ncbi:leukotriene A-4 hydrolase-like isoform X2 [Mytilus californianus]|uniref:leukotriene A-4 hydrolase-like isoform X2 n=1 Tax=Mytilus californianus TaxID=6549 RepID=UPI0022457CAD|nr:leukotriene A-4 hydrolase-like isoform X2 [Mytilus californianus]
MIPFLIKSAVSFLFLAAGIHYWRSGNMTKEGLSPNDPSSHSHPEDCRLVHLDLELNADFNKHIFSGFAHLTVEKQKDGVDTVVLDSKDLKIKNVTDQSTAQKLSYSLGDKLEVFGSRLEVRLPSTNGNKLNISIEYETSPEASAFQWLTADQTAGKRQPYLFSQCQAIHCRSFVPCQDTPSVKFPYTATITAPKEITLLMSAISTGSETDSSDNSKSIYRFEQKVPIPSYLIAIVGGDLESRDIGPRSKVWSEKEFVDAAAFEFSETETMLTTAEKLCGPYVWGRYDLLVLPPSFPYGGMENPCLTFVTPTLLAGDKSLADVVAHEISHSWTGNLVTNKNPEHFWLNEGHTVFVERKIKGRMYGEPYRQISAAERWIELQQSVVDVLKNGPYTKLIPDLRGVDPDDAFSIVPYEKGFTLLYYLETLLGGPDEFEPFLKAYIEKFKYKSIDSNQWKDFLFSFFQSKVDVLNKVDWDTWFSGVGMPPIKPEYDESLAVPCQELCDKWSATSDSDLSQFSANDILKMTSNQIRIFLYKVLLLESPLSLIKVKKMEELYKFNDRKNSEIRLKWLLLCLKAHWEDSIQYALKFVNEQGRMKFVRPIYRALYAWEGSRDTAIKNFLSKRPEMHSTTAELVGKDLHLGSS